MGSIGTKSRIWHNTLKDGKKGTGQAIEKNRERITTICSNQHQEETQEQQHFQHEKNPSNVVISLRNEVSKRMGLFLACLGSLYIFYRVSDVLLQRGGIRWIRCSFWLQCFHGRVCFGRFHID